MDVDVVVGDYCGSRGRACPREFDDVIDLHVTAIEEIAEDLRKGVARDGSPLDHDDGAASQRWQNQLADLSELAGALGAAADANVMLMLTSAIFGLPNQGRAGTSK